MYDLRVVGAQTFGEAAIHTRRCADEPSSILAFRPAHFASMHTRTDTEVELTHRIASPSGSVAAVLSHPPATDHQTRYERLLQNSY